MKKELKGKIFTTFLFFGISIIIIFYSIFPLLEEIKANSESLVSTRTAMNLLIAKTKTPKNDYEELERFTKKMEDLFIPSEKPIEAAVLLRDLAKKHELEYKIESMNPSESLEGRWPSLNINLIVSGKIINFFRFLEEIEHNKLLIKIDQIDIRKSSKNDKIDVTMLLKIFYRE